MSPVIRDRSALEEESSGNAPPDSPALTPGEEMSGPSDENGDPAAGEGGVDPADIDLLRHLFSIC